MAEEKALASVPSAQSCAITPPVFSHHPQPVHELFGALQDGYHHQDVAMEIFPGKEEAGYEEESIAIDEFYGRLRLIPASELHKTVGDTSRQGSGQEAERMAPVFSAAADRAQSVDMEDILTTRGDRSQAPSGGLERRTARVLVVGAAGAGKTISFTRKAALDWARGQIWRDVELLFALPLRQESVSRASNLQELLRLEHLGFFSRRKVEEIKDYIGDHLNRVCIILDGLDEVGVSKCSDFVQRIIRGQVLTKAHVIVTSRPSGEALTLDRKHPFSTRLELLGFRKADIARYVRGVLSAGDSAHFLAQLDSSSQLAAFMQTPVNCVNACKLYRAGIRELPKTVPTMTSAVLQAAIRQEQSKSDDPDEVADDWKGMSAKLKASAMELAAFSFHTLVSNVTLFRKEHFDDFNLSDEAKGLGLLVGCQDLVFDRTPQWRFPHLTMQESMAAKFISSTISKEEIPWLVSMLGATTGSLNTFWQCLAAELDEASANELIRAILESSPASEQRPSASATTSTPDIRTTIPPPPTTSSSAVSTTSSTASASATYSGTTITTSIPDSRLYQRRATFRPALTNIYAFAVRVASIVSMETSPRTDPRPAETSTSSDRLPSVSTTISMPHTPTSTQPHPITSNSAVSTANSTTPASATSSAITITTSIPDSRPYQCGATIFRPALTNIYAFAAHVASIVSMETSPRTDSGSTSSVCANTTTSLPSAGSVSNTSPPIFPASAETPIASSSSASSATSTSVSTMHASTTAIPDADQCYQQTTPANQHALLPDIHHLLRANRQQLCQLADRLSEFLNSEQSDRLAIRLLSSVVQGEARIAVQATMSRSSDLTTAVFFLELLLFWKRRVPQASLLMLKHAVAEIDQSAADQCFPSLSSTMTGRPPETSQEVQSTDKDKEEFRQRLLLAIRCYQEFSFAKATKPVFRSLCQALRELGLDLRRILLTASDCCAIGLVLEVYNSAVTVVDILGCYIDDEGYQQLDLGLQKCCELETLYLACNEFTDKHTGPMSTVIKTNVATLRLVGSYCNNFSSTGISVLHQYTHLCQQLQLVSIGGGEKFMDSDMNMRLISRIVSNCKQMKRLNLSRFTLSDNSHSKLLHQLADRKVTVLGLQDTGLSVHCTAVMTEFLERQQDNLEQLWLHGSQLTDAFLYDIYHALCRCTRLKGLNLSSTQLTSLSLPVLAQVVRRLPHLTELRLAGNDFRTEDEDATDDFVLALAERQDWRVLWMPVSELLSATLHTMVSEIPKVQFGDIVSGEEWARQQRQKANGSNVV